MSAAIAEKSETVISLSLGELFHSVFFADGDVKSEIRFLSAKRRESRKLFGFRRDIGALVLQIIGDRAPQRRVCNIMRGIGCHWPIAAGEFVRALCAGFDDLQAVLDRIFD